MINVIIPSDSEFADYENEIKNLYENSKSKIGDSNSFEFVKDNTLFYMFVKNRKLIGGIYYFLDNGKLFFNGFAGRKHFEDNLECVKMSLNWFKCDIYAESQNRASALCLLKCGFEKIGHNLFKFTQPKIL